ncbi:Mevalonate kinase [Gracilaria domingensis]|nr:Mevalonate kinase [Gracilaria domingensis]
MGSYFSQEKAEDSNSKRHVEVPNTETLDGERDQRPRKKRRIAERKKRIERARAPPTRAMKDISQENGDAVCIETALKDEGAVSYNRKTRNSTADMKGRLTETDTLDRENLDANRIRKRKYAVFLGYNGERYYGMQINPGVVTIEQVLLAGFHKAGLVSDENKDSPGKVQWMRAARTDKGVSAIVQCVSLKLELPLKRMYDQSVVDSINYHLPEDIQVYGLLRPTGGFNARSNCHRRRYEYIFPVRLLGGKNGVETELNDGEGDPRAARLTSILKRFEGTHCFANFTEGLTGSEDASKRYMIKLQCSQPFKPPNSGIYYVSVEIFGQSFLLHQIRKMVGLSIYVYLGHAPEEAISVALCPNVKFHTPMAPALGLLLENLVYDNYNKRFKHILERPISSDAFEEARLQFKTHQVYRRIAEKEREERILETWVKNCRERFQYKREEVLELHRKFVLTDVGKEEQRKEYVASLYPIRTSMEEFLESNSKDIKELATELRNMFEQRYGVPPSFLARAPGRVNLIGEHLDYNGFPVIGVALRQGSMLAGCLDKTDVIEIQHARNDLYESGKLRADGFRMVLQDEDASRDSDWIQYVSWGVKSVFQNIAKGKRTVSGGGRLLLGGNLPLAAGLASSSSLVTLSALATARLNRRRFPKQELALLAAEGERVGAGTRGGAVDHLISACGRKGCATKVWFIPRVGVKSLRLPSSASLIAVGSHVKARKGFDRYVKEQFNLRAAECRIASAILARRLKVHLEMSVTTPGQLFFQAKRTSKLECRTIPTLRKMVENVMDVSEIISYDNAKKEIGVSEVEFRNRFLIGVEAQSFAVGKRMAHVLSEVERVEDFENILENDEYDEREKLCKLGNILREGHESLRVNYESSCKEVDELVDFCLANGAAGSRVTGAGWGGFTINLVPVDKKKSFMELVRMKVGADSVIDIDPSAGACIFAIHSVLGVSNRNATLEPAVK